MDRNYWLISSGKDGELWPTFWNEKVVALGYPALGDLRLYPEREDLVEGYMRVYPDATPGQQRNNVTQLWSFYQRVKPGELAFVRSYGAIIGIGEVQDGYDYIHETDPLRERLYSEYFDDYYPHIHRVRWLSLWGGIKQSTAFTRLTLMEQEHPTMLLQRSAKNRAG